MNPPLYHLLILNFPELLWFKLLGVICAAFCGWWKLSGVSAFQYQCLKQNWICDSLWCLRLWLVGVYNRINKRTLEFGVFDSPSLKDHSCTSVVNEFQMILESVYTPLNANLYLILACSWWNYISLQFYLLENFLLVVKVTLYLHMFPG